MNTEQIVDKMVSWIQDKVRAIGCKGVVLGMSGGLDSSVVSVLCKYAFPQGILGVLMPCYSLPEDKDHAMAVADRFSIPTEVITLDSVFDALRTVLPPDAESSGTNQLAEVNLKVRLRMIVLYYYANKKSYLVVGSSNRSELTTGYFTKHGDGGVDIMPIGNLVKEQVRELAGFLKIPQEIIDKPPSAGLWQGQTDEDELGFSYRELDRYLLNGEATTDFREKIDSRIIANKHKLQPPPIPDFQV